MVEFNSVPIQRGDPKEMEKFKSHKDFVPVFLYDFELLSNLGHGEVGMLMKPNGDIYKRIFYV